MYSRWKRNKLHWFFILALAITGCSVQSTLAVKPTEAPVITQAIILVPKSGEGLLPDQTVSARGVINGHCPEAVAVRILNNFGEIVAESSAQTRLAQQTCTWQTILQNPLPDGTSGWVVAGLPSTTSQYLNASDAVPILSGSLPSGAFVTIHSPEPYQRLDSAQLTISGRGGSLFENHLVVQVEDDKGTILAVAPVIIEAENMGGQGNWQIELAIPEEASGPGQIVASASSPKDGSLLTIFKVPVICGPAIP